jgi:hypothetical protein
METIRVGLHSFAILARNTTGTKSGKSARRYPAPTARTDT